MKKGKRYITFYKISPKHTKKTYGMMCTRTWWQCFKLGIKHIRQGRAIFFKIRAIKN